MMFTGVAVGNTGLVLAVLRWMRLRRQTKSSAGSSDRIRTRSYHGADVALATGGHLNESPIAVGER
jgi:hypothetical protein